MSIRYKLDNVNVDDSIQGSLDSILDIRVYLDNPFGVFALSPLSSQQDIQRKHQKMSIAKKIGMDPVEETGLRRAAPISLEEIDNCFVKLKDPFLRIVLELFWPWPASNGKKNDAGMGCFEAGQIDKAIDQWKCAENSGRGRILASHNLAIVFHAAAIDASSERGHYFFDYNFSEEFSEAELWSEAFSYWRKVIEQEAPWDYLKNRVAAIEDPRLKEVDIDDVRDEFVHALLDINVQIACQAINAGNVAKTVGQAELIMASNFEGECVEGAYRNILRYANKRVIDAITTAKKLAEADSNAGLEIANHLMEHTNTEREILRLLYNLNDWDPAHETANMVAKAVMNIVIGYGNDTQDYKSAALVLDKALLIAVDDELRTNIKNNIESGKSLAYQENIYRDLRPIDSAPSLYRINGIGFTVIGGSDVDLSTGSYLTTYWFCFFFIPIIPIRRYRVIRSGDSYRFLGKQDLSQNLKRWRYLVAAAAAVFLIYVNLPSNSSYSPPKSYSSSRTQTSQVATTNISQKPTMSTATSSSAQTPAAQASQITSTPVRSTKTDEIKALRGKIDTLKTQLNSMENQLQPTEAELSRLETQLNASRGNTSLYNSLVDSYNAKLAVYKQQYAKYKSSLDEHNRLVNQYNALIKG